MSEKDVILTIKIAMVAVFIAVGIVLSYLNPFGYFLLFGAKINPFAHLINVITGVLIGVTFSSITALGIATIRFSAGIGTIHAFHGGISGAPKYVEYAAFTEPIGTVFIGGTIGEIIMPIYGSFSLGGLLLYWWLFFWSSLIGCIIGFIILKILKRSGYSRERFY
ncbi:MAG: energy coupling factor transporter S component ThiW [Promethearchaeota archaeon]